MGDRPLDKALRENLWLMGEATATTLFPILTGEFTLELGDYLVRITVPNGGGPCEARRRTGRGSPRRAPGAFPRRGNRFGLPRAP